MFHLQLLSLKSIKLTLSDSSNMCQKWNLWEMVLCSYFKSFISLTKLTRRLLNLQRTSLNRHHMVVGWCFRGVKSDVWIRQPFNIFTKVCRLIKLIMEKSYPSHFDNLFDILQSILMKNKRYVVYILLILISIFDFYKAYKRYQSSKQFK